MQFESPLFQFESFLIELESSYSIGELFNSIKEPIQPDSSVIVHI